MALDEVRAEHILRMMMAQRSGVPAPVDALGWERVTACSEESRRFKILVGLLLSTRTKDVATCKVMKRLDESIRGGLSPEGLLSLPDETLNDILSPVNYHVTKSKYIKEIAEKFNAYGSASSLDEVVSFKGVGYKIGILYMQYACNEVVGISVDTHVHRIANRLELVKTRSPLQTQRALEASLKRELWGDVNRTFVGFGQTICLPKGPRCSSCSLSDLCPYNNNRLKF